MYRSKHQQLTISPSLQNLDNSEGRGATKKPVGFHRGLFIEGSEDT
jgi:hypothetical protein